MNSIIEMTENDPRRQEEIFSIFENQNALKNLNSMFRQISGSKKLSSDKLKNFVKTLGYIDPTNGNLWNHISKRIKFDHESNFVQIENFPDFLETWSILLLFGN